MALVEIKKPVNTDKLKAILNATVKQFDNEYVPQVITQFIDEMDQKVIDDLKESRFKISDHTEGSEQMQKDLTNFRTT